MPTFNINIYANTVEGGMMFRVVESWPSAEKATAHYSQERNRLAIIRKVTVVPLVSNEWTESTRLMGVEERGPVSEDDADF